MVIEPVVSIYGAFTGGRYKKLEDLRNCLRDEGYNAILSTDLEELYPRREDETEDEYNLRISEKLMEVGDVHIFVFFKSKIDLLLKLKEDPNIDVERLLEYVKKEINLNMSPAIELKTIYDMYLDDCIVIFYEESSIEELKTLLKGLMDRLRKTKKTKKIYCSEFRLKSEEDLKKLCDKFINAIEDCKQRLFYSSHPLVYL